GKRRSERRPAPGGAHPSRRSPALQTAVCMAASGNGDGAGRLPGSGQVGGSVSRGGWESPGFGYCPGPRESRTPKHGEKTVSVGGSAPYTPRSRNDRGNAGAESDEGGPKKAGIFPVIPQQPRKIAK